MRIWSALSKMAVGEIRWIINALISGISCHVFLPITPVEFWPAIYHYDGAAYGKMTFDLHFASLPLGKIL